MKSPTQQAEEYVANMITMNNRPPHRPDVLIALYLAGFNACLKSEAVMGLMRNAERLLERIDHNNGIGEYNGGPAFVVEPLRKALTTFRSAAE